MEHSPSWEANRSSAAQEKRSVLHSRKPATSPYPEPERSSPCLPNPLLEDSVVVVVVVVVNNITCIINCNYRVGATLYALEIFCVSDV